MWARLKVRYSELKNRGKLRTIERRRLKDQIRYLRKVNGQLREELQTNRYMLEPQQVFNHHYPAQMIALAVFIVLRGGSLRCAAATAHFYAELMGWQDRFSVPSASTIRNWVCRCGLYTLGDNEHLSGNYVAILDESIQIGKEKLLLMLGIPLQSDRSYCRALSMQEVVVLGMEVQTTWTGQTIADFIMRNLNRCPNLRISYIVSDQGNCIRAALRRLHITWVSDCSHVMMNAVKTLFKGDQTLSGLGAKVGQLRQRLFLTDFMIYLPATLREKDRFLRLFTIIQWADRLDQWWPKLCPKVKAQLRFYRKAWPLLRALRQVRYLIQVSSAILKTAGLSAASHIRWQRAVNDFCQSTKRITSQARGFIDIMDKYFKDHLPIYQDQNQVLCCSDIIESTFGRYKNKGGVKVISADVLSIALYNQTITPQFVAQAMNNVSGLDLIHWQEKFVCINRYGLMKQKLKSVE